MGPERVEMLRRALLTRGTDPEQINDMVMGMGGENFIKVASTVEHSARRSEQVMAAGPAAAAAGLFEYETLLSLLGIDSSEPAAVMRAVAVIHHLMDHSAAGGCELARQLVENDPLRLAGS